MESRHLCDSRSVMHWLIVIYHPTEMKRRGQFLLFLGRWAVSLDNRLRPGDLHAGDLFGVVHQPHLEGEYGEQERAGEEVEL